MGHYWGRLPQRVLPYGKTFAYCRLSNPLAQPYIGVYLYVVYTYILHGETQKIQDSNLHKFSLHRIVSYPLGFRLAAEKGGERERNKGKEGGLFDLARSI